MTYPDIWLLRHGQTAWNAEGRIQGQMESELTDLGRAQARLQAELIAPILKERPACFASPLGRAQETARIALSGVKFSTDARLAELNAGEGQGLTRAQADLKWPGISDAHPRALDLFSEFPGSEGFAAAKARIVEFLGHLEGPSVIVAHGLVGQIVRGLICGLERAEMAVLPNQQGCVYVLRQGAETVLRHETVSP